MKMLILGVILWLIYNVIEIAVAYGVGYRHGYAASK